MLNKKQIKAIEKLTGHKKVISEDDDTIIFVKSLNNGSPIEWNARHQLDIYICNDIPQKITYSICPHNFKFDQEAIPVKWLAPLAKILEVK